MTADAFARRAPRFSHHTFHQDEVRGPWEIVPAESARAVADPTLDDVGQVPLLLRRAGVAGVILVHGTFAGDDVVGVVREIARFSPGVAKQISALGKRWFDDLIGEVGNYTESFAECLSSLINPPAVAPIGVMKFHWSGENHHLGRADGVMSLLETVSRLDHENSRSSELESRDTRILVMAHSHGGNVIAMLSQIIGANIAMRRAFFEATRLHYQIPILRGIDLPDWERAREMVLNVDASSIPRIDVATFGTPLRYRWNLDVCPKLLHFIQHRSLVAEHPNKACLPRSIQDVIDAAAGDYIQHLGIAGTDFLPSIFAWRDWIVERRMARMFESTARRGDLLKKVKLGRRESSDGVTLLVDYPDTDDGFNSKLFGHGVYTARRWLPYHLNEITRRFYGLTDA
jgi:hypothetical protein